ncbi:MAG: metal-dependent hydrolase, partial [Actinomycetota bacterium]|nr:metal-dependent hydrolase [Actinomycetota bacterium]
LSSEETRALFGDEQVQNLFLWHALEESEHKAVAFDVYKAVGGTERVRVFTMNAVTVGFVVGMTAQVVISLLLDRQTYRRGNLRRSWRRFRRSPIMQRTLWEQLRDYNRPGFHPDDRDTNELVARWRTELFGDAGTLNDKLTGAAA